MNIGLIYGERLKGAVETNVLGGDVHSELERLIATLQQWSDVEHNDDGTHKNITTNTLRSTAGLFEKSRTVAAGKWTDNAFNALNFTAPGSTWTLTAPDQLGFSYEISGDTMTVNWYLQNTSVGAGAPATLDFKIPESRLAAERVVGVHHYRDNGGAITIGPTFTVPNGSVVSLYLAGFAGAWAAAANTTETYGQLRFRLVV